jgi:hypothetical protein
MNSGTIIAAQSTCDMSTANELSCESYYSEIR